MVTFSMIGMQSCSKKSLVDRAFQVMRSRSNIFHNSGQGWILPPSVTMGCLWTVFIESVMLNSTLLMIISSRMMNSTLKIGMIAFYSEKELEETPAKFAGYDLSGDLRKALQMNESYD